MVDTNKIAYKPIVPPKGSSVMQNSDSTSAPLALNKSKTQDEFVRSVPANTATEKKQTPQAAPQKEPQSTPEGKILGLMMGDDDKIRKEARDAGIKGALDTAKMIGGAWGVGSMGFGQDEAKKKGAEAGKTIGERSIAIKNLIQNPSTVDTSVLSDKMKTEFDDAMKKEGGMTRDEQFKFAKEIIKENEENVKKQIEQAFKDKWAKYDEKKHYKPNERMEELKKGLDSLEKANPEQLKILTNNLSDAEIPQALKDLQEGTSMERLNKIAQKYPQTLSDFMDATTAGKLGNGQNAEAFKEDFSKNKDNLMKSLSRLEKSNPEVWNKIKNKIPEFMQKLENPNSNNNTSYTDIPQEFPDSSKDWEYYLKKKYKIA